MQKILMAFVITAVLVGPIVMHDTSRLAYATPQIMLTPISGAPGSTVEFTVSGITPGTVPYQYSISINAIRVASGIVQDPTSNVISGSFPVPPGISGLVTVVYTGQPPNNAAGESASTQYTVITQSSSASVQGSVTIAGTCGIATTGALQYGTLIPSATSTEQTLTVQNTGTVSAALLVSGNDWLDGSSVNQINVGNTKWSIIPGTTFAGKTALTTSPVMMTGTLNIAPATLPTYWQLQVNLNHGTFTGSLTQTVSLSVSC